MHSQDHDDLHSICEKIGATLPAVGSQPSRELRDMADEGLTRCQRIRFPNFATEVPTTDKGVVRFNRRTEPLTAEEQEAGAWAASAADRLQRISDGKVIDGDQAAFFQGRPAQPEVVVNVPPPSLLPLDLEPLVSAIEKAIPKPPSDDAELTQAEFARMTGLGTTKVWNLSRQQPLTLKLARLMKLDGRKGEREESDAAVEAKFQAVEKKRK